MSHQDTRPRPSATLKDARDERSQGRLLVLYGPTGAGKGTVVGAAGLHGFVPLTLLEFGERRPRVHPALGAATADRLNSMRGLALERSGMQAGWAADDFPIGLQADSVVCTCDFVVARLAARRFNGRLALVHRGGLDEAAIRRKLRSLNTRETEIETRILNARDFHERLGLLRMVADAEIVNDGSLEELSQKLQTVIHALWPPVNTTATA